MMYYTIENEEKTRTSYNVKGNCRGEQTNSY